MIIFKILEFLVGVLVIIFFVTQIIEPAIKGILLFPYFRKQGKLEKEEVKLNQRDVETSLEYKIEQRKQDNEKEGKWQ